MTNVLTPSPKQSFLDNNGRPAVGYKLFTYVAGTTTKASTYRDETTGSPNSNPIVLDYRGSCDLWIPPNVAYKYVLAAPNDTDPPANPIWTVDDVVSSQLITLYGGVDTGSANNYILNFDANFDAYQDGIIIYWIPANTNTGASLISVNGLGGVSIFYPPGGALNAGSIIANQITAIMYMGSGFVLLSQATTSSFFTGTLTGMSASTTGNVSYVISGGYCTLVVEIAISGTSNATSMTMTGLPAEVRPSRVFNIPCTQLTDNGVTTTGMASISGGTITFSQATVSGSRVVAGAFTNPGTKGIAAGWNITYPLS